MKTPNDLLLIMDHDADSLAVLRGVADLLGCERLEAESPQSLNDLLATRTPTLAVLAVDKGGTDGLAALQALGDHAARPAIFLIGSVTSRVLSSARRTAESRGLTVIGVSSRPVDALLVERALTAHLTVPPPIARGELEQALEEHQLTLQYQPKFALGAEGPKVQGVEALVRWQHPRRGSLRPGHFLPAVEQHGLMTELTDFVMTEALRQAGVWRAQGIALEMVVNLSPGLVRDREFPQRLALLLREHAVPPEQLVLDITEGTRSDNRDLMLEVFTKLRILGVGLSLDNFGTGMSSLTELYRMPYSEIKIDHSLIVDVAREREAQLIVRAIADLGHSLQIAMCAAGVETREMLDFVRAAKFDSAQGRLLGSPARAADIEQLVKDWPRSAPAAAANWGEQRAPTADDTVSTRRFPRLRRAYVG